MSKLNAHVSAFAASFWDRVDMSAGPDGRWLWTGPINCFGYGQLSGGDRPALAHRVAFALAFGPIQKGRCVLHRCDNPPCVNPAHLFAGTRATNNADKIAKGRARYRTGTSHPATRSPFAEPAPGFGEPMTYEKACQLRREKEAGAIYKELVKRYGISFASVYRIASGKSWARPDCLHRHIRHRMRISPKALRALPK